ncbi:uncharacterized protein LOC134183321 isoform X2 [Corticium candelabrum]|uniref:uncharacterized protein LOC134183321 isoform X2 n=1 Tax=Corticium candelabrum TaxID=121492 RepID=UPI002E25C036|nr:uncharacterized protein LOC134183321 isoform X2 [Corticium candelabrum]
MNYSTIVFVGPHRDTLEEFKQTLLNLHPECNTSDPKVCVSKEVLQENLDFSQSYVKCFLVMPRGDRTLVYIENDDSSMYKELDHICKDEKGNWHPERAFIVFYRNKDVRGVYYEDSVELLWDSGCQKRLEEFSSVNQLISFKEKLNHLQKKAIYKFLTRKTSERSQSMEAPTRKTPVIVQPLPSTEETTECLVSLDIFHATITAIIRKNSREDAFGSWKPINKLCFGMLFSVLYVFERLYAFDRLLHSQDLLPAII